MVLPFPFYLGLANIREDVSAVMPNPESNALLAAGQTAGEWSVGKFTIQADAEGEFTAFETPPITAYNARVHSEINWLGYR